MADIFADCPWCKGLGVPYARVRRRRGWPGNDGPRGPCTFCPGEREKAELHQKALAQERYERTGDYCEPGFSGLNSFYMVDVKTGKMNRVGAGGEVQELDGVDVIDGRGD